LWHDLLQDVFYGFPEPKHMVRVVVRLAVAGVLGGLLGLERQLDGKRDSVRTYTIVALGAALFTLVGLEGLKPDPERGLDVTRLVQGIATGIGFLGAGTILKLSEQHVITGLTTAAGIWLTAAIGMAVGAGWLWPAMCGVVLAWAILYALHGLDHMFTRPKKGQPQTESPPSPQKHDVPNSDD
jgi:putative Mg2+ transporter-C (MgtC) family protein